MDFDVIIVGCGCSGLYCALNLPDDKTILMLSKGDLQSSDSFLAQGGMCMLTGDEDYDRYFEDTLRAGHYKNNRKSVEIMINSSREVVDDLLEKGVEFDREADGSLALTREGAHSAKRIVFHKDITGREITSKLLEKVKCLSNVKILENTTMIDIIEDGEARGVVIKTAEGEIKTLFSSYVVLATGGIGGLYEHSTNFKLLTGDGVAVCARHGVELKDMSYIQIHPTTLYSEKPEERSFLISESVRGEGAKLLNKDGRRFVYELLPRDILTQRIYAQMKTDGAEYVFEDLRPIDPAELKEHFPNIVGECEGRGFDVSKTPIPVVPAQHYFMGGIAVGEHSETSMKRLYAVGETACNGVHGANRLASNSLLESLVFAKRAAKHIAENFSVSEVREAEIDKSEYDDRYFDGLKKRIFDEIEKDRWVKIQDSQEHSGLRI